MESGAGWARTREAERTREVERTEDADASDEQSTRAHMASFILARMGRRTLIFSFFFAEVMMTNDFKQKQKRTLIFSVFFAEVMMTK